MQQDSTFVAARIVGPLFAVAGVALITQHQRMIAAMPGFLQNDALMLLAGFVVMAMGLALVTLHRRWAGFSAALLSIIGWITVIRGAVLLLFPGLAHEAALFVMARPEITPIAGCVIALIGVWLSYAGYISGVLRVESPKK